MMKKMFIEFSCFILFLCFLICAFTQPVLAGQVVTEVEREWARGVLSREKGLEAKAGENTLAVLYFQNET
ncbi:MAG TPA: hypothetical protein ENN05_08400, partial [Deltaproteobacteria bacterium]|nr:hypothetical protein [Deltaproteobacteria bacterium]